MALLGLGILIATISFFCYRNPPTSWLFLPWVQRSAIREKDDTEVKEAPRIEMDDGHSESSHDREEKKTIQDTPQTLEPQDVAAKKAQEDRKAMPPPPLFLSKPSAPKASKASSSPDTPKATSTSNTTSVPSFNLNNSYDDDEPEAEPTSQFPAINSAQRASAPSTRTNIPPNLSAIPTCRQPQPPLRSPTASLMSPPMRSPLPNRTPPGRTPTNGTFPSSGSSLGIPPQRPAQPSGTGLAPPPTHTTIPTKPRKKVLLTPGHSPLDWATLTRNPSINLTGLPPHTPLLRVPPSLLKQFSGRRRKLPDGAYEQKDAWTVLSGKVYNITPYLPYHPGGEPELLKCAGRDGTKLFGEVHPWVNWEGMLEGCLVGISVSEEEFLRSKKVAGNAAGGDGDGSGGGVSMLDEMD